jgi:hypothetical protein
MYRAIVSYFTAKPVRYLFRDKVTGRHVYAYEDKYGERWMKDHRWSLFRVKIRHEFMRGTQEGAHGVDVKSDTGLNHVSRKVGVMGVQSKD